MKGLALANLGSFERAVISGLQSSELARKQYFEGRQRETAPADALNIKLLHWARVTAFCEWLAGGHF